MHQALAGAQRKAALPGEAGLGSKFSADRQSISGMMGFGETAVDKSGQTPGPAGARSAMGGQSFQQHNIGRRKRINIDGKGQDDQISGIRLSEQRFHLLRVVEQGVDMRCFGLCATRSELLHQIIAERVGSALPGARTTHQQQSAAR